MVIPRRVKIDRSRPYKRRRALPGSPERVTSRVRAFGPRRPSFGDRAGPSTGLQFGAFQHRHEVRPDALGGAFGDGAAHRLSWRAPPLLESCEQSSSLPLVSPVLPPNLMSPWSIVCALVHTGVSPFITRMRDRRRGFRACRTRWPCISSHQRLDMSDRKRLPSAEHRERETRVRSAGLLRQSKGPAYRVNPRY